MFITKGETGRRPGAGHFLGGVITGLLAALLFAAGGLISLQKQGVRITVQTDVVADQVRDEVRAALRRELPGLLAGWQQSFATRTAQETAERLAQTKIDVGGFQVSTPPAVVSVVQRSLREALQSGAERAIRAVDVNAVADQLGSQAHRLVRDRLAEALADQPLRVEPWPGVSVPVRIIPR